MSSTQPDLTEFSRQFSEEASRLPGGGGRGGEGGGICSRDVVVYCSGSGVECVAMEPWSTHEPSAPKGHERGHHHHHHHHQQRHHHQHQQSQEEEEEEDDVERETRAKPLGDEQIFSDVLSENPGFTFDSVGPCRLCCGCSCCPGRTEDDNKRCIFSGGLLPPTATHVDCFDLLNHGPPTPRPSMRDESMLACGAPSLKASQNLFFLNERSENLLLRLSLSLTLGSLLAALTFLWLHLMIPTLNFIWVSLVSFVVLVVSFAVMFNSLLVRCTAALVLPSIGTDGGRMALVLLLLGCLLSGPMAGINSNLRQMSVYYDCLRNHHHRNFGNYSDTASGITPSSSSSSSSSSLSSSPVFLQPSSPSSPFQYVIHPSGTITSSSSSPSRSRLNDSIVKLLMSTHRVMESLETLRGGLYSNKHNYHHYRSHIHSPHHQDNHHPYLYHHQRHHHNQHHNQDRQHAMGDKRDSTGFDQRREVYGFENTCSSLMKHAHDVCLESIREAKVQCLGVIDALGNVYHHAKDILDTINPDRWLTRQQILMKRQKYHQMSQQQQQYPQMRSKRDEQSEDDQWTIEKQRQIFQQGQQQNFTQHQQQPQHSNNLLQQLRRGRVTASTREDPGDNGRQGPPQAQQRSFQGHLNDNKDVCKPLDGLEICRTLGNTSAICRPSKWASDVIVETINSSLEVVAGLQRIIAQQLLQEPQIFAESEPNKEGANTQQRRQQQQHQQQQQQQTLSHDSMLVCLRIFDLLSLLFTRFFMVPAAAMILIGAARRHVRSYLTNEALGEFYVDQSLHVIDGLLLDRSEALFPLKNFERRVMNDKTRWSLSPEERRKSFCIGLDILLATAALTAVCLSLDQLVTWCVILKLENRFPRRSSLESADLTTLEMLASTNEALGDLVEALISVDPNATERFSAPQETLPRPALSLQRKCQSPVGAPSAASCALPVAIQLLLFLSVLLKAYLLRFRDSVSGFFYPETKWKRALRLYSRLLEARKQNIRLLAETGRRNLERLRRDLAVLKPSRKRAWNVRGKCQRALASLGENFGVGRCFACERLGRRIRGCPAKRCDVRLCSECAEDFRPACPTCAESAKPGRTGRATPGSGLSQLVKNRYGSISEEASL